MDSRRKIYYKPTTGCPKSVNSHKCYDPPRMYVASSSGDKTYNSKGCESKTSVYTPVDCKTSVYPQADCKTYVYPQVDCKSYVYPQSDCKTSVYPQSDCKTNVYTPVDSKTGVYPPVESNASVYPPAGFSLTKLPKSRVRINETINRSAESKRRSRRRSLDGRKPTKNDPLQASPSTLRHPDLSRIRRSNLEHQNKYNLASMSPDRLRSSLSEKSRSSQEFTSLYETPKLYITTEPATTIEREKIDSLLSTAITKDYENERLHSLDYTEERTDKMPPKGHNKDLLPRHSHIRYQALLQNERVSVGEVSRYGRSEKSSVVSNIRVSNVDSIKPERGIKPTQSGRSSMVSNIDSPTVNAYIYDTTRRSFSSSPRVQERDPTRKGSQLSSHNKQTARGSLLSNKSTRPSVDHYSDSRGRTSFRGVYPSDSRTVSHSPFRMSTEANHFDQHNHATLRNVSVTDIRSVRSKGPSVTSISSVKKRNENEVGFHDIHTSFNSTTDQHSNRHSKEYAGFSNTRHSIRSSDSHSHNSTTRIGYTTDSSHTKHAPPVRHGDPSERNVHYSQKSDACRYDVDTDVDTMDCFSPTTTQKELNRDCTAYEDVYLNGENQHSHWSDRDVDSSHRDGPNGERIRSDDEHLISPCDRLKQCTSHRCNKCVYTVCDAFPNGLAGPDEDPPQPCHQGTNSRTSKSSRHSMLPLLRDPPSHARQKYSITSLSTERIPKVTKSTSKKVTVQSPPSSVQTKFSKGQLSRHSSVVKYRGGNLPNRVEIPMKHTSSHGYSMNHSESFSLDKTTHHTSTQTPSPTMVNGSYVPSNPDIPNYSVYECDPVLPNGKAEVSPEFSQQNWYPYPTEMASTQEQQQQHQDCSYDEGTANYYNEERDLQLTNMHEQDQQNVEYSNPESQMQILDPSGGSQHEQLYHDETNVQDQTGSVMYGSQVNDDLPNDQMDQQSIMFYEYPTNQHDLSHKQSEFSPKGLSTPTSNQSISAKLNKQVSFSPEDGIGVEESVPINVIRETNTLSQQDILIPYAVASGVEELKSGDYTNTNQLPSIINDPENQSHERFSQPEDQRQIFSSPSNDSYASLSPRNSAEGGFVVLPQNASYEIIIKHSSTPSSKRSTLKQSTTENGHFDTKNPTPNPSPKPSTRTQPSRENSANELLSASVRNSETAVLSNMDLLQPNYYNNPTAQNSQQSYNSQYELAIPIQGSVPQQFSVDHGKSSQSKSFGGQIHEANETYYGDESIVSNDSTRHLVQSPGLERPTTDNFAAAPENDSVGLTRDTIISFGPRASAYYKTSRTSKAYEEILHNHSEQSKSSAQSNRINPSSDDRHQSRNDKMSNERSRVLSGDQFSTDHSKGSESDFYEQTGNNSYDSICRNVWPTYCGCGPVITRGCSKTPSALSPCEEVFENYSLQLDDSCESVSAEIKRNLKIEPSIDKYNGNYALRDEWRERHY